MEYIGGGKWEDTGNIHGHRSFRNERPVAEKKVVKTVAKVAVVAAAVYYGGSALLGAAGASGGAAAAAGSAAGATTVGSVISAASPYIAAGGLALQGVSMYQQKQAAEKMQEAESERQAAAERVQASEQRQSDVQAQQARMAAVREQRILQGRIMAAAGQGGFAFGGTSAVAGSTGALTTQLGTAIGNINVAQGFAQEQGAANVDYGRATSNLFTASNEASGWQSLSALGKELRQGQTVGQTLGTIFS